MLSRLQPVNLISAWPFFTSNKLGNGIKIANNCEKKNCIHVYMRKKILNRNLSYRQIITVSYDLSSSTMFVLDINDINKMDRNDTGEK